MKTLISGGLVLALLSAALAQGNQTSTLVVFHAIFQPDATCGAGESETTVTIGRGDSYKYKTSARSVEMC